MSIIASRKEDYYSVNELWNCNDENRWKSDLRHYNNLIKPQNRKLENEMADLDWRTVKAMTPQQFYSFLYDKYFVWKYTAPNRLATTRMNLKKHSTPDGMLRLEQIHKELFAANIENTGVCLDAVQRICGLGYAGASGLLALMFPSYYATVDQFVVYALREVNNLPECEEIEKIKNPESLGKTHSVLLINILRRKARELNQKFNTDFWTPRKIDMVLWAVRA